MAATEILAVGTNTTPSSDVTVEAGEVLTVCIKGAAANDKAPSGTVLIQLKDDDSNYWTVDDLTRTNPKAIIAPGTYRFVRETAGSARGVFSG